MPEFDIGPGYALYARYLHPVPGNPTRNLFDPAARTDLAAEPWMRASATMLADLRTAGIVTDDADGIALAPLRGLLVLPDSAPEGGTPLVLLMHGQAPAFRPRTPSTANESMSYRGFGYLQRHLATLGIASMSVNLNVVNHFSSPGADDNYQRRVEVTLLHLALLSALHAGTAPTGSPLRCRLASGPVPLDEALRETAAQPAGSPVTLLRALVRAVATARMDLTRLGVFGHSRGGASAAEFGEMVVAAGGATPGAAIAGMPLQPSSSTHAETVAATRRHMETIIRDLGAPLPAHLKGVVSFEPDGFPASIGPPAYPLALPDVMLLAVSGSHDEDVGNSAANIYERAGCPKALLVMHGATHARFHTVWRAFADLIARIEANIRCQAPIRIMSNARHEQMMTSFVGAFFGARLRGMDDRLLIFTGERRAPPGADVTRCWRFPIPVNDPTGVVSLDAGISVLRTATSTGAPVRLPMHQHFIGGWSPYVQQVTAFRIARPAAQDAELLIPIGADQLVDVTHLSCRVAKEHDGREARARAAEPLRNFELALFTETGLQIGLALPGRLVPSIVQQVYPVRKFMYEANGCADDTVIYLQTVEVPLTQFLTRSRHTRSDLGRVRELRFRMLPAGKPGEDVFWLVDFLLSRRVLPTP